MENGELGSKRERNWGAKGKDEERRMKRRGKEEGVDEERVRPSGKCASVYVCIGGEGEMEGVRGEGEDGRSRGERSSVGSGGGGSRVQRKRNWGGGPPRPHHHPLPRLYFAE